MRLRFLRGLDTGGIMIRKFCIAAIAVVALGACDKTNWESSIFRDKMGHDPTVKYAVTDAKQRLVLNVPNSRPGASKDGRIICAEPSPDVAQALSEAVKVTAAVNVTGKGSGSGSLDRSFAQSVAQLGERLAVIQLLRDKMYRACEAYANGAVGASGYTLMLARLDKTMVSMLSAEMAAGAFGRNLAQIGGQADTAGADPAALKDAVAEAAEADKELAEAEAEETKDQDKIDAARAKQTTAHANLQSLIVAAASSSAKSILASQALGTISGRNGVIPANATSAIATIHQSYMDDHGIEPLVDACVVAMDSVRFKKQASKAVGEATKDESAGELADAERTATGSEGMQFLMGRGVDVQSLSAAPRPTPMQQAEIDRQESEDVKERSGAHAKVVSLLAQESAFAAFCADRIFSFADFRHSFVRQMTTLKRDLRGSRITSPSRTGWVITPPPAQSATTDPNAVKAEIDKGVKKGVDAAKSAFCVKLKTDHFNETDAAKQKAIKAAFKAYGCT